MIKMFLSILWTVIVSRIGVFFKKLLKTPRKRAVLEKIKIEKKFRKRKGQRGQRA